MRSYQLILLVFVLFMLSVSFSFAYSEVGEVCKSTADCREGYCSGIINETAEIIGKTCQIPEVIQDYQVIGKCFATAHCKQGFCKGGECILIQRQEFGIIQPGVKSGCAGIIENCIGIWCLFCNVTWIILAIGAVIAAWTIRKRGMIIAIVFFIIPIAFGLFLLPVLGFLLAIVEIFAVVVIRKRPIKELMKEY